MSKGWLKYLGDVDWADVSAQYWNRLVVHEELVERLDEGDVREFAKLALGMSNENSNYSASEHGLGPKILTENGPTASQRVRRLARSLADLDDGNDVPQVIRKEGLAYCRIGVGSEMSAMVNPTVCWVANARSIWTHLLMKHDSVDDANDALRLYRESDPDSRMYWPTWSKIHEQVGPDMLRLLKLFAPYGEVSAPYLLADAICNALYSELAD